MADWYGRWIKEAQLKASYSKDPSTKVGAVAVGKHNQLLSSSYNGFPRGIRDDELILNNREEKYKYIIHAEQNLIYNACLSGISLEGSTVFVYGLPICHECAKGLIQVGVSKVRSMGDVNDRWMESNVLAVKLFKERGINYRHYHASSWEDYIQNPYRTGSIELRT